MIEALRSAPFVVDVLVKTFGSIHNPVNDCLMNYIQIFFSYNVIMNVSVSHNFIVKRNNTYGNKIKKFKY